MTNDIETPSTPKSKRSRSGMIKASPSLETSPTLTTATSFSPTQEEDDDESPRIITIDHRVSTSNSSSNARGGSASRSLLLGMSKPVFAIVAATVLATSGSAAWFFTEWLSIPGLKEQISALSTEVSRLEDQVIRLENQVDRLSTEVDELAHENDRYSMLNYQLNQTAQEYLILNDQLNASTMYLSHLNEELNHSNAVYSDLNAQLSDENTVYASLNSQLNETQQELSAINQDLFTVVNFLNDTSTSLQRNLETIVDFLADQISINRFLVLETLKNTYQQRVQSWDCGYRDYFLTYDFIRDGYAPIIDVNTILPEVLDYVDLQLLGSLCLDKNNLQDYLLANASTPQALSSNELIQGVSRYLSLAMNHYFLNNYEDGLLDNNDSDGIRPEEWAEAFYQCSNLARPFLWSGQ